ncbi:MAG: phage gp6-like head-tail connector protein [Alphaproteobacteria bacterium]|nr:phage gp6-like head-tail connector protein [Alphaproteobacteria bacterium]
MHGASENRHDEDQDGETVRGLQEGRDGRAAGASGRVTDRVGLRGPRPGGRAAAARRLPETTAQAARHRDGGRTTGRGTGEDQVKRYRSLKRLTEPATEPVTLAEAKAHCRVDIDADDALIQGYIRAARELCEDYVERTFVTQQLQMKLDQWPIEVELPRPPMSNAGTTTAVIVTYTLSDTGATQTLPASVYRVDRDATPGVVRNLTVAPGRATATIRTRSASPGGPGTTTSRPSRSG